MVVCVNAWCICRGPKEELYSLFTPSLYRNVYMNGVTFILFH